MECVSNEDSMENRCDHLEAPPNTQCYHLKKKKDLSYLKRGRYRDKKRGRGNLSTYFLKRRKHLKFLVHRFVCFVCFFFQETFAEATFFKVYIL